jgi:HK97 family phage prohead protease
MPVKNFQSDQIEFKDSSDPAFVGSVVIYASVFDNVDSDGDKIIKGAFKRTLKERGPQGSNDILHLMFHDTFQILGKPSELKEDDFGLRSITPIPATTLGKDTYILYKTKVYDQHSIGYKTMDSEQEVTKGVSVNILKELKLWEISTVPWGANPMARTSEVKSETKSEKLDEIATRLDRIGKAITDNHFSEKTMNLLQIEIQLLSDAIKSIEAGPVEPTNQPQPFDPISFLKAYDLGLNITKHFNFE